MNPHIVPLSHSHEPVRRRRAHLRCAPVHRRSAGGVPRPSLFLTGESLRRQDHPRGRLAHTGHHPRGAGAAEDQPVGRDHRQWPGPPRGAGDHVRGRRLLHQAHQREADAIAGADAVH
jgi:hypothetical protein